jgi:hypothetical protein
MKEEKKVRKRNELKISKLGVSLFDYRKEEKKCKYK